jgi:hypothetical protein
MNEQEKKAFVARMKKGKREAAKGKSKSKGGGKKRKEYDTSKKITRQLTAENLYHNNHCRYCDVKKGSKHFPSWHGFQDFTGQMKTKTGDLNLKFMSEAQAKRYGKLKQW